ncbi:hypothetical protein [Burkholderia cepacia]|uniref:Uncharacterized protein n=1 Tax=Burkholderia cepacia TaxID=292 RepID=A0A8I1APJ8_BURCE|nr:hypothetical protein [Burkholderia cepacia]MBA9900272.1 hypothetical protein [Burkholderia cepacia]MBA9946982.1 hypothetical protein [Burkholderia cepacia]MBA9977146.1 hypothetical protein [Burkholderia cepacia]MBA9995960.1 hypothetical protein [Burkholderia cepacia]MBB0003844.1 hypothetical protein [Burkholderia cepacia]
MGIVHSRHQYPHERVDCALLPDRRAFDRLERIHAFGGLGAIGSAFAGAALLSAGLGLGQILPLMADVPLIGAVAGLVMRRALADESKGTAVISAAEVSANT